MKFKLLTNGMVEGYPKEVSGDVFKVRDWRDLGIATPESFYEVLIDCMDKKTDFTQTEFIKSIGDLTRNDIIYTFFQQRVNCTGDEVEITYICKEKECGKKNSDKFSMVEIKEIKISKKVNKIGKIVNFKLPTYNQEKRFNEMLEEYYKLGVGKYIVKVKDKNEDGTDGEERSTIEQGNLIFLTYYNYIDKEFSGVDEYLDWILECDGPILKELYNFKKNTDHGFEGEIEVKCKSCGKKSHCEVPLEPSFFLE